MALYDAILESRAHPALLCNKGAALQQLGDLAAALRCYDGALVLKPADANIHVNRGICLHAAGRHADAIEAYGRALRLEPNHVNAHYNRGNSHREIGCAYPPLRVRVRVWHWQLTRRRVCSLRVAGGQLVGGRGPRHR